MFAFRLALQCGYPHPRPMLQQMTTRELQETMIFAAIEPFGEYREELRHGQLMQLLDAANFKRDKSLAPIDFMNYVERPPERKLTQEELQAKWDKELGL
jgi:hypothetical protein